MLRQVADARLKAAALPPYTGFGTPKDLFTITRCNHVFRMASMRFQHGMRAAGNRSIISSAWARSAHSITDHPPAAPARVSGLNGQPVSTNIGSL